jgi:hypothetical protein
VTRPHFDTKSKPPGGAEPSREFDPTPAARLDEISLLMWVLQAAFPAPRRPRSRPLETAQDGRTVALKWRAASAQPRPPRPLKANPYQAHLDMDPR